MAESGDRNKSCTVILGQNSREKLPKDSFRNALKALIRSKPYLHRKLLIARVVGSKWKIRRL